MVCLTSVRLTRTSSLLVTSVTLLPLGTSVATGMSEGLRYIPLLVSSTEEGSLFPPESSTVVVLVIQKYKMCEDKESSHTNYLHNRGLERMILNIWTGSSQISTQRTTLDSFRLTRLLYPSRDIDFSSKYSENQYRRGRENRWNRRPRPRTLLTSYPLS